MNLSVIWKMELVITPRGAVCGSKHFINLGSGSGDSWERQVWDSPSQLPQGLLSTERKKFRRSREGAGVLLCPVLPHPGGSPGIGACPQG